MADVKYYLDEAGLRALWAKLDARDKEIVAKVLSNKDALELLNSKAEGDNPAPLGSVERTVSDKVAEEIAKVVAGAPAAYDTLKEIADWIAAHPEDTTAMNSAIQANSTALEKLKSLLGVDDSKDPWTSSELTTIKTNVTSNTDRIAALEAKDGAQDTKIDRLVKEVEGNGDDVNGLIADVTTLTGAVSTNKTNITTNTSDIATIKKQIEALTGGTAGDVTDGLSTETINSICTFTATLE